MSYFLVTELPGPKWDHALPRREQARWAEHAAFIDTLAEQGGVVLAALYRDGTLIRDAIAAAAAEQRDDQPMVENQRRALAAEIRRAERALDRYYTAFENCELESIRFGSCVAAPIRPRFRKTLVVGCGRALAAR